MLIVPTTQPEEIEQFGIRVADAWKLGRKGVDDGAILLVAKNDRRVRIEVGCGSEGALPDAIANRIIDETIAPHFKLGDYDGGVEAGVDRMIAVVNGEPLPEPDTRWEHPIGLRAMCCRCCWWSCSSRAACCARLFGRLFGSLATGGLAGGDRLVAQPSAAASALGAGVIGVSVRDAARLVARLVGWRRLGGGRRRLGGGGSAADLAAGAAASAAAAGGFSGGGASGSW